MSDPLRVALVAEGVVIEAALRAILADRPFVLQQIFPEGSISFGPLGAGWAGVYRWCRQSSTRGGGRLSNDRLVFQNYDVLILHLDADVAGLRYSDAALTPRTSDRALPCARPCPPAADTTGVLRDVLLSWCGEAATPARTVICMPSKSTEAWVVAALFPGDPAVQPDIECLPDPATRLSQQPIDRRIRKATNPYRAHADQFRAAWPSITAVLGEAGRFQTEFLAAVPTP
jgi:hypothetical protein